VPVLVCGKSTSRGVSAKRPKREGNRLKKSWVDDLHAYHELKYGHNDNATRMKLTLRKGTNDASAPQGV